jgi:hypothetical protein
MDHEPVRSFELNSHSSPQIKGLTTTFAMSSDQEPTGSFLLKWNLGTLFSFLFLAFPSETLKHAHGACEN